MLRITGHQLVTPAKLELAKKLRREMAVQEQRLWAAMRQDQLGGLHFRRQQVIAGYVVDFYCAAARLAVELDGAGHAAAQAYDAKRDRALAELGITTLRVRNWAAATNLSKVLRRIAKVARRREGDLDCGPPNPLTPFP